MRQDRAFTLLELMAVLGLASIIGFICLHEFRPLSDPLRNGTAEVIAFMKQARAKAISTTSAYTVQPLSATRIGTVYASFCSDTETTADNSMVLDLPQGISLSDTDWSVCFSSRGLPDANVVIPLSAVRGGTNWIEVFLGGAVKEVPEPE